LRKVLFIILPVVVLALGASGGWYWWNVLRFLQSTDDAYVQSDISLISPKVEGYIKEVRVADNQEVAEGDVLFEPARRAAGDDRGGAGDAGLRRRRSVPGAARLHALQRVDVDRFC
jgi:multidrug efflux pump subunit AcrA (membrane-fusion protein)